MTTPSTRAISLPAGCLLALGASLVSRGSAAQVSASIESQSSGVTVRLQAVSVVSPRIVWASGAGGTWVRTSDGGATWTSGVVPGADSLEFRDVHAFDARSAVLLAAGPGERSRLYRTQDAGATWELVFQNREPRAFFDCIDFKGSFGVAMSDAVDGRFPILRTRNGGRAWEPYHPRGEDAVPALEGEGGFAASGTCIQATDGGFRIATAVGGRVIQFSARGAEAFQTPVVHGKPTAGVATIAFRSPSVGVAAGGDLAVQDGFTDNVAVTNDGGRTWTLAARPPFPGPIYGAAYTGTRSRAVLVVVGPKGAAWSTDDAATWQPLAEGNYWGLGFAANGVGWLVGPSGAILRVELENR